MANKIASAALQYSKWLSRFICWVWAIYRFTVIIASAIRPEASASLASTLPNLDWIMLVNEGTYLINSLGEKYIYSDRFILSWINKGGLKNLSHKITAINTSSEDSYEEPDEEIQDEPEEEFEPEEEPEEEGESNG